LYAVQQSLRTKRTLGEIFAHVCTIFHEKTTIETVTSLYRARLRTLVIRVLKEKNNEKNNRKRVTI